MAKKDLTSIINQVTGTRDQDLTKEAPRRFDPLPAGKKRVTYSIDAEIVQMIKQLAVDLDTNMSEIIEIVIQDFDHRLRYQEVRYNDLLAKYKE